ncbi:MAG: adenylyltransferase [Deltaproteobacteria bacterium CG11_big_fil_rev_8_21_14_0_20_49_13]|nr:MAG: adenylyltransferase [Deltaproteobacteria bacterium CG11_big_fil_rev_8_21_14_0_20_49_13]
MNRYIRQITLTEIGEDGQRLITRAKVLIVGAGGLGSPAALYLAGAGVGTVGIADPDKVELINLHRQVIHTAKRIGENKAASAGKTLKELNSDIKIKVHETKLDEKNAEKIFKDYDIILGCTDNFEARYIENKAAVRLSKPLIYGSILKYQGQISVFDAKNGPCFACVFPEPPPETVAPKGSVAGILGMMPGVMGTLQALEAIKLICEIGESLTGKLLIFDGLTGRMKQLEVNKDSKCNICSAPL